MLKHFLTKWNRTNYIVACGCIVLITICNLIMLGYNVQLRSRLLSAQNAKARYYRVLETLAPDMSQAQIDLTVKMLKE